MLLKTNLFSEQTQFYKVLRACRCTLKIKVLHWVLAGKPQPTWWAPCSQNCFGLLVTLHYFLASNPDVRHKYGVLTEVTSEAQVRISG